ncbi:MAG TPA: DUF1800 family protein, partial [bacterium]|nr:DUF1800 family protein [bacterium]
MYPGTRVAAAILSLGLAAAPAAALTVDEARHILLRTGFGATPAEIAPLLSLNRQAAVDALIASAAHASLLPRPQWYGTYQAPPRPNPKDTVASQAAQAAYDAMMHQRSLDIVTWWYRQMMSTSSPLLERMVLFWHGHFTSSIQKVNVPDLMLRQNLLLRQDALGNFRQLVHDIARDPAMLLYLDGGGNVKGHPNENFARELMELFTLG